MWIADGTAWEDGDASTRVFYLHGLRPGSTDASPGTQRAEARKAGIELLSSTNIHRIDRRLLARALLVRIKQHGPAQTTS